MDYRSENGTLTLFFRGKIASENAPALGSEAGTVLAENTCNALVIDIQDLTYISSAGLRLIMKLGKTYPDLKIVNASPDVYNTLEITGFVRLFNVKKAFREFSVENCKVIGRGAIGTVYRYDAETVIKVYRKQTPLEVLEKERHRSQFAFINGIPTAISYDIVRVGSQYGLIYELLSVDSLGDAVGAHPENTAGYAEEFAAVLKGIHSHRVRDPSIPTAAESHMCALKFTEKYMRPEDIEPVRQWMLSMPDGCCLLHGDYHPKNIMVQNGELLLIDMGDICIGHPIWDLAAAYFTIRLLSPDVSLQRTGIPECCSKKFVHFFLASYFESDDPHLLARMEAVIEACAQLRKTISFGFSESFPPEQIKARLEEQRAAVFPRITEFCETLKEGLPEMNALLGL